MSNPLLDDYRTLICVVFGVAMFIAFINFVFCFVSSIKQANGACRRKP